MLHSHCSCFSCCTPRLLSPQHAWCVSYTSFAHPLKLKTLQGMLLSMVEFLLCTRHHYGIWPTDSHASCTFAMSLDAVVGNDAATQSLQLKYCFSSKGNKHEFSSVMKTISLLPYCPSTKHPDFGSPGQRASLVHQSSGRF